MNVKQLSDVRKLSEEKIQELTSEDVTFKEYQRFSKSQKKLPRSEDDFYRLETELLSHHKTGYIPDHPYSFLTLVLMVLLGK